MFEVLRSPVDSKSVLKITFVEYGRVKLAVEDIEGEEAALLEDLYAADRKFSEYYNVGRVFAAAQSLFEIPHYWGKHLNTNIDLRQ